MNIFEKYLTEYDTIDVREDIGDLVYINSRKVVKIARSMQLEFKMAFHGFKFRTPLIYGIVTTLENAKIIQGEIDKLIKPIIDYTLEELLLTRDAFIEKLNKLPKQFQVEISNTGQVSTYDRSVCLDKLYYIREFKNLSKTVFNTIQYEYNKDSLLFSRSINSREYRYSLDGLENNKPPIELYEDKYSYPTNLKSLDKLIEHTKARLGIAA